MRYRFGDYLFDTERYELHRAGVLVPLRPKECDVLAYLLAHRDRVVSKDELFAQVWPGQFVGDATLHVRILAVRKAIGDDGTAAHRLRTVRGRGYRFVAPVVTEAPGVSAAARPLPAALREETPGSGRGPAATLEDSAPLVPPTLLDEILRDMPVSAAEVSVVPSSVDGERKLATLLACSLAPGVRAMEAIDPEVLHSVRQRFFTQAQQAVQRYEGTIQHFVDNTFVAFFGTSVAQEDHARRAVLAALHIQEACRDPATPLSSQRPLGWTTSMGVHTGEVIVGPIGDETRQIALALGDTTRVADQLLRMALPGEIVLSPATARLVPALLHLESVTPIEQQSMTALPTVYKVLGLVSQQSVQAWQGSRVVRQFVGRSRDMAMLQALLAHVEAHRGQVVGIAGEPGIGKSRLLYEFRQQVHRNALTYWAARCVSYGQATPYLPLLDLVRQACHLRASDTPEETAVKVHQYFQAIDMVPETSAPYLLHLLNIAAHTAPLPSLSPQSMRRRMFDTLIQLHLYASRQGPLVLEIEDLHWIDPSSEEWLMELVEHLVNMPILLLLSYRSGYQPPWVGKSYATQLALQPLTQDESQQIVRTILPAHQFSRELVQAMVTRGQGNPFFLEELAYAIGERGGGDLTPALPETVQVVLAARLDRLPVETKTLLQVAAVIGAEVPRTLLQTALGLSDSSLSQHLDRLQEAELFFTARAFPEPVYAFKHALTQDVAYHSLLRSTRQSYHQRIVEVLVEQCAELVQARPEVAAHHYTEAGLIELAIPYWQRAGDNAVGRSAYREAIAHCTKGLEVLGLLPDTPARARYELGLQRTLAGPLLAIKGIGSPEVAPVRLRVCELCEQVGDDEQLCRALLLLTGVYNVQGELRAAHETATKALYLAQGQSDISLRFRAYLMMGLVLIFLGELVAARAHLEHALTLWNPHEPASLFPHAEQDSVGSCFAHLAQTLGTLGYPDQALHYAYVALHRAQELSHPYSRVYALVHVTLVHQLRRDAAATRQWAEATLSVCEEQEFSMWTAFGKAWRGWALCAQGQGGEGLALMYDGIVTSSDRLMRPREYAFLAEAYARQGQIEKGLAILTEQIDLVERSDGRFYTAELYRLKGELLWQQSVSDPKQAEGYLLQALDLSRRSQAKWWELRAALSLSRLWQQQRKCQQAYDLLAPVYNWFTEGFDTADLQEAKAFMEALTLDI